MQAVLTVVNQQQVGFTHLLVLLFLGDTVLQDCTSISTTEGEYVALSEACKEAIWLARLVKDLGLEQCLPILRCDSQSASALAKNPVFHSRMKHIDVRYHFSQECLANKNLDLVKNPTSENTADALTKKAFTRDSARPQGVTHGHHFVELLCERACLSLQQRRQPVSISRFSS
ncbi:hypothetical protein L7F22_033550 [Adiantum nelumboides]|nr:hypothetical protein [Adiantum nelumboides]